jgi:hypothetical protein
MLQANALTTVEAIKQRLELDDEKRPFIEDAINTASSVIERFCNRKFAKSLHTDLITEDEDEHICSQFPVLRVLSINAQPLENPFFSESGVVYEKFKARSRLQFEAGYVLPAGASELEPRTLPHEIEFACIDLVAYVYADDEDVSEREAAASSTALKSFELGDMKATLAVGGQDAHLIPDDIQAILIPYRKLAFA